MGVAFLGSYLCISILEFKFFTSLLLQLINDNLCISILEFKFQQL